MTVAVLAVVAPAVTAEVVRFDVTSRSDVGSSGYERIEGRAYFAVDPNNPRDAVIVDLDKAPRNAAGRVEFSSDVYILRPKSGGSGAAIVDVVNRGRKTVFSLNRPADGGAAETGDGFLMRHGFTIVCVGWEFDVPARGNLLRIDAPIASDNGRTITGIVRAMFTPDRADATATVGDLAVFPPIDPSGSDSVLTVRDGHSTRFDTVPRSKWHLSGNVVTLEGGFEPGRNYEVTYRAANPPIGGLSFAAVRDVAAWIKHAPDAAAPVRYAYGFGVSQSGRFLRTFLYEGFNADEQDRLVFDGVIAHIAGASRLDVNRRFATPTGLGMYNATAFPFADAALRDPVSSRTDGLLENERARAHQPKVFYTNTAVEYWGGGRTAALTHTTPDGRTDLTLLPNIRSYFLAGAQHTPGVFPPPQPATTQQRANPTDYWWTLRALIVAMDRWVREGAEPPASQYPRRDGGTLVDVANVAFPAIPGVQSPRTLTAGLRASNAHLSGGGANAPLPLFVPQVDGDGNERAGIRLPEIAVPLATYTGWNFRAMAVGGTGQLVPLVGSYIPFPRTKAERDARRDPRGSIEERYASREQYLSKITDAASALAAQGYLLADDVAGVVKQAREHWDVLVGRGAEATAAR